MKKVLLSIIFAGTAVLGYSQMTLPYVEQFDNAIDGGSGYYSWSYSCGGLVVDSVKKPSASEYTMFLTQQGGAAVTGNCYGFILNNGSASDSVDLSANPDIYFRVKSNEALTLVVALQETASAGSSSTDASTLSAAIPGDNTYHDYHITLTPSDFADYLGNAVDPSRIGTFVIFPQKATDPAVDADITFDYFSLGGLPILTGIVDRANNTNVNVYPNPASSSFFVKYNGSNAVVKVSDMAGAMVKTVSGSVSPASVDLSGLKAGIYVVSVEVDGMPVSTEKLVVK